MASSEDELIGIPFPEHSSDLLSSLNEQRHRGVLCDITIKTQGLEYRTHRAVLAASSLYFRKLFTGTRGSRDVCELDFLKPDALGALLDFAYTATLTISTASMRDVLRTARLLEIPCVVEACVEILRGNGSSWEEMSGDAAEDLDCFLRARQYLERFISQENGDDSSPPMEADSPPPPLHHSMALPPKPVQLIPRKHRRKFLQVNPSQRVQNGGPYLVEEESMERADSPPADPPSPDEIPPGSDGSYGRYTPEHGLGREQHIFVPPSPPEDILSDEETPELMYPATLDADNPESVSAASPDDKLVRKRRSQMPQECPVCHKIIHGAGKLPRHMRTHTGEKPFVCQVCGVRFTRNDKLKIHMRKHTGERPYCCAHCSARFLHSYDLKNHMHLHTGDRPYECSLCHKAFAKEDHLQRHMKGQNCLEVRTRRRRKEDPPPPQPLPGIIPAPALDLTNGKIQEELHLSMLRYWPLPRAPSGGGSPEGPLVIDNS